jgi:hypothetical protein
MRKTTYDLKSLDADFQSAYNGGDDYHGDMVEYIDYYRNSAFYAVRKGERLPRNYITVNLLQTFADKNIQFNADFPKITCSNPITDDDSRLSTDLREKIVYATWAKSMGELLQPKWAADTTLQSVAIAETCWDRDAKEVYVKRYDPRYCYWVKSNNNDNTLQSFFMAVPVTKEEIWQKYGKVIGGSGIDPFAYDDTGVMEHLDDREWTMMITYVDDEVRAVWAGDQFIETPHKHDVGTFPIDICIPLPDYQTNLRGDFYLRPLIPLQAELNHAFKMRANIIRKMGSPAVWARGLYSRQLEEVLRALQGDGGLVGLKGQGELGILSPPETAMIDNHINDLILQMQRIAGYNNASFGESVGANASGDTYGMLFAPTTRSVGFQQQAWKGFYRSINSKILYLYDKKLTGGVKKKLVGYKPYTTVKGSHKNTTSSYDRGGVFSVEFTRQNINGQYDTEIEFTPPAPKDELAWARLWYEMASAGQISKVTMYDKVGIKSPEDERQLLELEQSNPYLNPEGMSRLAEVGVKGMALDQKTPPAAAKKPTSGSAY